MKAKELVRVGEKLEAAEHKLKNTLKDKSTIEVREGEGEGEGEGCAGE